MGLPLVPLQLLGGSVDLEYQAEDHVGVEAPAASLSDFAGINEWPRWTRDLKLWKAVQHTLSGLHDFLGIAKRTALLRWDGTTDPTAYTVEAAYPSSETFTATRISTGLAKLAWLSNLAHADYGVLVLPVVAGEVVPNDPGRRGGWLYDDGAVYARTQSDCHVRRFGGSTLSGMAVEDGDMAVVIFET